MAALANGAEHDERSPRDIHWVTADGDVSDVVESLASLVEHLNGREIPSDERVNVRIVIAALRDALSKAGRPWLVCIDNVDGAGEPEVNAVLGTVVSITEKHGRIIVTSRAGSRLLLRRMQLDQNIALEPLRQEDAMYVIWMLKNSFDTTDNSVDKTKAPAERFRRFIREDLVEYKALQELCDPEWVHSLAGLPLALVQAGAYIRHRECTFFKVFAIVPTIKSRA